MLHYVQVQHTRTSLVYEIQQSTIVFTVPFSPLFDHDVLAERLACNWHLPDTLASLYGKTIHWFVFDVCRWSEFDRRTLQSNITNSSSSSLSWSIFDWSFMLCTAIDRRSLSQLFPASSHRHQLLQLRSDASLRTSVPGIIGDASIWCVEVGRLFKAQVVCISSPLPSPPHKKSPKFCYKSQHCFEASNLWNTIRRRILCVRFQQVYKNQLRPTVSVSLSDLCVIRPF